MQVLLMPFLETTSHQNDAQVHRFPIEGP